MFDKVNKDKDCIPYGTDVYKDILVDSTDVKIRINIAKEGYGLDKLIYDKDFRVRLAVAKNCYKIDTLMDDKNLIVHLYAIYCRYGLFMLIFVAIAEFFSSSTNNNF